MCYHRPAAAGVMLGAAVAGAWAVETHRAAVTTVLGAVLAVEVLAALVTVMVVLLRVREEHSPERVVEHGHHHPHEHPIPAWPHQAWERDRAA